MDQLSSQVVDHLNIGVMLVDHQYNVMVWNKWMERASGIPKNNAIGRKIGEICPGFLQDKFKAMLERALFYGENRFCSGMLHNAFVLPKNATELAEPGRQNMQIEAFYHDGAVFALIQIIDITGHYKRVRWLQHLVKELEIGYESVKEAEEHALRKALCDPLTGLCNRISFNDRLTYVLNQAHKQNQVVALLFLDLDGFKAVNDSLGHHSGDLLLKKVAARLSAIVRQSDTVCRLGGDEYTIILPDVKTKQNAANIAKNILDLFLNDFNLDGTRTFISASIGISLFPSDADNLETLVKCADSAMYSVKASGKNGFGFYSIS